MTAKLPPEIKRKHDSERYCAWAKNNRGKVNEYTRKWRARKRAENPEPVKAQRRKWMLKSTYGITPEQYDSLLVKQGYACGICRVVKEGVVNGKRTLFIDHNHKTGEVRGLLCHSCNAAIGLLKEQVEFLLEAVRYLS